MTTRVRCRCSRAIALASLWLAAAACRSTPEEEKILRWLQEAVSEVERSDAGALLDRLSRDFRLSPAGTGKKEMGRRLLLALARVRGASVHYPRPDITLAEGGETAEARFPFLLLRGARAEDAGRRDAAAWLEEIADRARLMRLTVWLRQDGGKWLAYQARLERFNGVEFRPVGAF